ncbi:hypothetical protein L9W92_16380 [Pelotomaculum terephthalicicum JT]|uniref:hypothetical protein n=1 Tax=Pelotomaculum terephthalicicum TaxID=206393 RepID=UPI001F0465E2|nr:hypothetical protein [Pelotomaculum terephthalicicum]MCG9969581.1 hypothetical protein [Pelotomaculum terephthalicicum JT]
MYRLNSFVQNYDISSPRLWIRRVVLFESPEKKNAPIRSIPFSRGLNIIWGVELPDDAVADGTRPVTLSGHSVGKTILCRLIRYCLGESAFGNPGVMIRIKHSFPKGWVGMELTVDDQEWAILKPIGQSGDSKAAKMMAVENLFDQGRQENQYRDIMAHLQSTMMSGLQVNAPPNADKPYEWKHLLAWLTRDQESRFQSLHDWRSSRSGADTAKFQKPKEHALYLIRLVLDLVQDKELEVSRSLADAERELKQREARIAELRREPEYRLNQQEEALKQLLGLPSTEALNADMSDLSSPVFILRMEIEQAISQIQHDIERIDLTIAQKRIWLASYDEQRRVFKAVLEMTEEATELLQSEEPEGDTIRKLRELRGKDCLYGNVPFLECFYVRERLAEAEKITSLQKVREDKRVASETERRLEVLEQQREDHDQVVALLNELRRKLEADIAEKRRKEIKLSEYRDRLQRFDYHLEQRQQALDLIEGRTPSTKLYQENARAAELRENIVRKQDELRSLQKSYGKHLKSINEVYNALIKNVLSDTYSGALRMPKGELQFHIEEVTGLSGEAVETLALVLADLAAMLCSCLGIGHHPRFLLHDSPREADLDRNIYSRYLQSMWILTNDYGGQDKAPFQYIVTTTSKPPKELEAAICLRLEAHPETKMLFGRLLTNSPINEQLELFSEEDKI